MASIQHAGAEHLLSIIRNHQRRGAPLTYADAAVAMGRHRDHGRAVASMCDLLDAAAALSGRPLLALIAVKSADHQFNPKAWAGDDVPDDLRERVFRKSLAHTFTSEDYRAIARALKQLEGRGNHAAWDYVREKLGSDRLLATIAVPSELAVPNVPSSKKAGLSRDTYALVLAENESTAGGFNWNDITGERYQFPKNYRNKIRPGMPFVYYSGTRNATGGRKDAHYFGHGLIGDVYPDPDTVHLTRSAWKWLADIVNYTPFNVDVSIRGKDNLYVELGRAVAARNYWGVGVRPITKDRFDAIVSVGMGAPPAVSIPTLGVLKRSAASLMKVRPPRTESETKNAKSFNVRRSGQAKITGDAAERLFFEYLRSSEPDKAMRAKIVWVAQEGETPGFDIEDRRDPAHPVAYEVKGTVGGAFLNFELTQNEMRAAHALKDRYVIVLVSGCLGRMPSFEQIVHPAALFTKRTMEAIPLTYRIERRE